MVGSIRLEEADFAEATQSIHRKVVDHSQSYTILFPILLKCHLYDVGLRISIFGPNGPTILCGRIVNVRVVASRAFDLASEVQVGTDTTSPSQTITLPTGVRRCTNFAGLFLRTSIQARAISPSPYKAMRFRRRPESPLAKITPSR